MGAIRRTTAVIKIANGGTESTPFRVNDLEYIGLQTPAAFTGATFKFQGARFLDETTPANTDWQDILDEAAAAATVTVAGLLGKALSLTALQSRLAPWPFLRIVSAGAEAAERTFHVVAAGS